MRGPSLPPGLPGPPTHPAHLVITPPTASPLACRAGRGLQELCPPSAGGSTPRVNDVLAKRMLDAADNDHNGSLTQ